jgi:micrococcal nuclease
LLKQHQGATSLKRHIFVLLMAATPVTAQVHVRDADTIVVQGTPVRLNGVDAPELKTRSGKDAKRWMVNYLRGKEISCDLSGERTYDRWVGVCYANGEDIGAAVIAAGHALDCRRYSGGRYRKFETSAAKSRIRRAKYCK